MPSIAIEHMMDFSEVLSEMEFCDVLAWYMKDLGKKEFSQEVCEFMEGEGLN